MADEVEFHVKYRILVWDRAGCQSAWAYVQRHLPPMVDQRHVFQADLADDLGPHMQGVACGRPLVHHQGWPLVGPRGAVHVVPSQSWPSLRMIDSVERLPIMYATL